MKTLPALLSLLIWFSAGLPAQVLLVSPQPQLAPHDCPCVDCKCVKCECDKNAKPVESVKKSYTPTEASVVVRATKGKEAFQASGTAIDEHTVLTCWHVLREGWPLTVNGKPATVIRSDAKSDLALLATTDQLKPIRVSDKPLKAGDNCHAYGYEAQHKGIIYRWRTKIAALNRYKGFPNQSIIGRPQSGRSGGGLFNEAGELVGVCSAADGSEGLYAGHAAVLALIASKAIEAKPNTPDSIPSKVSGNSSLQGTKPAPVSKPFAAKTTPFLLQDCPDGRCPLVPKPSTPATKSVALPQSGCVGGQCFQAPALKASPSERRVVPMSPTRGFFFRRR